MKIVQHHLKYKELDGIDEIIEKDKKEHDIFHKENKLYEKYNISHEDFNKIANKAHGRVFRKLHPDSRINEYIKTNFYRNNHYYRLFDKIDERYNIDKSIKSISFIITEIKINMKYNILEIESFINIDIILENIIQVYVLPLPLDDIVLKTLSVDMI